MSPETFESMLGRAAQFLTTELRASTRCHGPEEFEQGVLAALRNAATGMNVAVEPTFHRHAFPDFRANGFGVEVKYTKRDTWHAVGNSVFERMRDPNVADVYVMFGKAGGQPEARWAKYQDCVTHVRVSNAPRFVVDMESTETPLFERFDIGYDRFSALSDDEKMNHIRDYCRGRLRPGEHLWWLEPSHTLPINVRLYTHLTQPEKRMYRAEAALLCPQICKGARSKGKYEDAAVYLLTHHGVFCPQARDLFSAGSVALRTDATRGGSYLLRALKDIETLMVDAAQRLDDALFVEYWRESCSPDQRIARWLVLADAYAQTSGWRPSATLFKP